MPQKTCTRDPGAVRVLGGRRAAAQVEAGGTRILAPMRRPQLAQGGSPAVLLSSAPPPPRLLSPGSRSRPAPRLILAHGSATSRCLARSLDLLAGLDVLLAVLGDLLLAAREVLLAAREVLLAVPRRRARRCRCPPDSTDWLSTPHQVSGFFWRFRRSSAGCESSEKAASAAVRRPFPRPRRSSCTAATSCCCRVLAARRRCALMLLTSVQVSEESANGTQVSAYLYTAPRTLLRTRGHVLVAAATRRETSYGHPGKSREVDRRSERVLTLIPAPTCQHNADARAHPPSRPPRPSPRPPRPSPCLPRPSTTRACAFRALPSPCRLEMCR